MTRAQRLAEIDVPRVPWGEHAAFLHETWKPGDHVSVFAPTDSGKSHLTTRGLLPLWPDDYPVLIVDVKGDDPTLKGVGRPVHKLPHRLVRDHVNEHQRYRLVVPRGVSRVPGNRVLVAQTLERVRNERGWVILLNEVRALTDARPPNLGISPHVEELWLRGRPHVTLIAETQRPAWVPGSMYDQCRHVYVGQILDRRAQDRLHEIGGHTDVILAGIQQLGEFEFVYTNRKSREVYIVKVPKGGTRIAGAEAHA